MENRFAIFPNAVTLLIHQNEWAALGADYPHCRPLVCSLMALEPAVKPNDTAWSISLPPKPPILFQSLYHHYRTQGKPESPHRLIPRGPLRLPLGHLLALLRVRVVRSRHSVA